MPRCNRGARPMLTPEARAFLALIVGLLVAATLGVRITRRRVPAALASELAARLNCWWLMTATFIAALAAGPAGSLAFLALVSFLAFKEYVSLLPLRLCDRPLVLAAYATVPLAYLLAARGAYSAFAAIVPLYTLLALAPCAAFTGKTRGFAFAVAGVGWGLLVTVFGFGHLVLLIVAPPVERPPAGAAGLMMYVVFIAQFSDVAQYIAGRALGRRPIVPKVSPNKTWAGFAGGLASATLAGAALAPWLTPLPAGAGALCGAAIGLAGFGGDVVVSALKRDARVKDASALLPGHGGVLDRIDSLVLSAPVFYLLLGALAGEGAS